ncbi:tetratricopeptide repeat protein [Steroidobacter flavus]|uniref:protein O-GlcNAc transferase n=1 Tax=Steroidobacter flavus TaxID=1842136 RepID=A0ABV8SKZ2_9GAMM
MKYSAAIRNRFDQAVSYFGQAQLERARALCLQVLDRHPDHCDALHLVGVIELRDGRAAAAADWLQRALDTDPNQAEIHLNLGNALLEAGRLQDAADRFNAALSLQPGHVSAWNNLGHALLQLDRHEDALNSFERALALQPGHVRALNNKGTALFRLKRDTEALAAFERATQLAPDYAEAWCNVGMSHVALKNGDVALTAYNRALELRPDLVDGLLGRADLYMEADRPDLALVDFHRALQLHPDHPIGLNHAGNALLALGRTGEALACYESCLKVMPDSPLVLANRGNALLRLMRYEEALHDFDRALALQPEFANALNSKASVLHVLGRKDETRACLEQLHALAPDFAYIPGALLNFRLQQCDWRDYASLRDRVIAGLGEGRMVDLPFPFLAVCDSPELQQRCGRIYTRDQCPVVMAPPAAVRRNDRLRIAYVSGDLREHAVSHLMAGVFREHDRSRFEVVAVSLQPFDESACSQALRASFDRFHVVPHLSDQQIAQLMREQQIDVAIDLMGHTLHSRPGIFAQRPAPVQIQHLGLPGTMGAPFMDYLIADEFLVPPPERVHYDEALILMPHCFQSNDDQRRIDTAMPSRRDAGLPDDVFVFCSFNNSYKINPEGFAAWMRILARVPDSVLWLVADDEPTRNHLRAAASKHDISAERLIFAPRVAYAQHLARMQLADLFLDTLPFNAGATASDALWAGVPLLTCPGRSFAARMAGSLLHALDLPELIANDPSHYETWAVELAHEPQRLKQLRDKLARQRLTQPLFQTKPHTRALEAAYESAFERATRGEAPATFNVSL